MKPSTVNLVAICASIVGGCTTIPMAPSSTASTAPLGPHNVTIYRDKWGVPHVYAAREEHGFYGAGYALAEDGLDVILRSFVEASGQSARAFGSTGIARDEAAALWRIPGDAQAGFEKLPAQIKADHRGFVAGIRQFMRDHPERVPAWAPELKDWMPTAVAHGLTTLISVYQARQGFADCGLPPSSARSFRTTHNRIADQVRGQASNQWVLAPRLTRRKGTLVWADSHSDFGMVRHEIRIHAGDFHSAGIVPAGTVFPLIGHNSNVAWGFTVGGPDTSDCYKIKLEADGESYLFGKERRRLITRDVNIAMPGGAVGRVRLRFSDHNGQLNPVVGMQDGAAFAISTAHSGAAGTYERQVYAMNKAGSITQFAKAQEELGLFPENVMAGDRFGDTYYISVGRVPRRNPTLNWSAPVNGNDPQNEWRGLHPASDLVQLRNPPEGWMQNNNIAPDTMLPRKAINAAIYPRYIFNDQPGRTNDRAERAKQLLTKATDIDIAEAVKIGMDELWLRTPRWQAALRAALAFHPRPLTGKAETFRQRLLSFDGIANANSSSAFAWAVWRLAVAEEFARRKVDAAAISKAIAEAAPVDSAASEALVTALVNTPSLAQQRFGGIEQPLGAMFRVGRGDVDLAIGGPNVPGSDAAEQTLRAFRGSPTADGRRYRMTFGQRHPMLTIFTTPLRSFSAVPWGQSEIASSPYYSDQSKLAAAGQLKPVWFHWSDLRRHIVSTRTLEIAPQ